MKLCAVVSCWSWPSPTAPACPLLELADGTRLSEGAAIVQYIADQAPDKQLAPANGSVARYQLQSWLNFIGTELHKGFGPLFNPATPADYKPLVIERLLSRLAWVDQQLEGRAYLMGEQFSVADAYLFTVTGWAKLVKLDLSGLQNIAYFRQRMSARPGVQAALKAEGLTA
jgi:glutathione S-transferase